MKKSGIIALFTLLLASASMAGAQSVTLKNVCEGMASHPVTRGDFVQSKTITIKDMTRELKSSGTFIFSLEGISWKTLKPFPSSMIITPSFIKQVAATGQTSVIDGTDNKMFSSIATTLSALFKGDLSVLENNFGCSFTDKGNGQWTLELVPSDSSVSAVMKSFMLGGSYSDGSTTLSSINMNQASGSTVKYTFSNQTYSKELTSDEKALFTK